MDATATQNITRADDLPDDVALLKSLVLQLLEQLNAAHSKLAYLLRQTFGQKSEKADPAQLKLFAQEILEALGRSASQGPASEVAPKPKANGTAARHHGRRQIPPEIPRVDVVHELAEAQRRCPDCGQMRHEIGAEENEVLELIPAQLIAQRHIRKTYACRNCQGQVVTAPKPRGPIEKGLAGPGLLAHLIVSKFDDHLPLYRQEEIFRRHHVDIPRSTMCDWLLQAAATLEPLERLMAAEVRQSKVIQTDDTPVPVQEKGRGQTRRGYFWVYRGDERRPCTVYEYTPGRSQVGPLAWLKGYQGFLQADAFPGYNAVFDERIFGTRVIEAGCWAHVRRYFDKAKLDQPADALAALAWISQLYKVEDRARRMSPHRRRKLRRRESRPILEGFRAWLESKRQAALPKTKLREGIEYALSNWQALVRYVDIGRLSIDNNAAERAIRPLVVSRKNWLFAGSDRGGRAAATFFGMVETAKRCGVNPWEWLADVLARINDLPLDRLPELLPDRWKHRRAASAA